MCTENFGEYERKALTLRCNNHPFGYLMKDLVGCVYCYVLIVVTKIFIIFCYVTVFRETRRHEQQVPAQQVTQDAREK